MNMGNLLKRLSYFAILGFPLSVLGTRLGIFDFRIGFAGIQYTLFLAAGIFMVGLFCWLLQRESNPKGSRAARLAMILSLLPLLGIGSQILLARSVPAIHNISTDTVNPPKFSRIVELRTENNNPLEYQASLLAEVQTKAYPNVKSLVTDLTPRQAHRVALSIASYFDWDIVAENVVTGVIEATETTKLWAFEDDVVIRITERPEGGSTIDMRSVSRIGQSDLGANAKRIEKFMAEFQARQVKQLDG
ncbi:MAG: hypothetical protein ACI9LY_001764 [Arenicella sp.]|jgi:uncharacterized protein (DUF1499 family)